MSESRGLERGPEDPDESWISDYLPLDEGWDDYDIGDDTESEDPE